MNINYVHSTVISILYKTSATMFEDGSTTFMLAFHWSSAELINETMKEKNVSLTALRIHSKWPDRHGDMFDQGFLFDSNNK